MRLYPGPPQLALADFLAGDGIVKVAIPLGSCSRLALFRGQSQRSIWIMKSPGSLIGWQVPFRRSSRLTRARIEISLLYTRTNVRGGSRQVNGPPPT